MRGEPLFGYLCRTASSETRNLGMASFFFFLTCYLEEREQHEWEAFSNRQR